MLDFNTLVTGLLIFTARIAEVSIGTVRIIVTVQGRSVIAFFLAIFELLIWIMVVSTVIHRINAQPMLALFYAFGYATGNVVGIRLERKLALGFIILRVITRMAGKSLADRIRAMGQPVTVFRGEGMRGTGGRTVHRLPSTRIKTDIGCCQRRRSRCFLSYGDGA